jgi:hypothetical protein
MKHIKNLKDLEIERLKIMARQSDLELQVYQDWQNLKHSLTPANIFAQLMANTKNAFQKNSASNSIVEILLLGALKSSAPLVDKLKKRFAEWLKK